MSKYPHIMAILSKSEERRRAGVRRRNKAELPFQLRSAGQPLPEKAAQPMPPNQPDKPILPQN